MLALQSLVFFYPRAFAHFAVPWTEVFFLHICCQFKTLRFKKVKDLTPTVLFVVELR